MSSKDIKALAEQDVEAGKINPDIKVAVVGENDLLFGLLRMWEAYTFKSNLEIQVFRNLVEAKKWIIEKTSSNS